MFLSQELALLRDQLSSKVASFYCSPAREEHRHPMISLLVRNSTDRCTWAQLSSSPSQNIPEGEGGGEEGGINDVICPKCPKCHFRFLFSLLRNNFPNMDILRPCSPPFYSRVCLRTGVRLVRRRFLSFIGVYPDETMASQVGKRARKDSVKACVVCCEEVQFYALGVCDHWVCFKCCVRMRVLGKENYCPVCRADLHQVGFQTFRTILSYSISFVVVVLTK